MKANHLQTTACLEEVPTGETFNREASEIVTSWRHFAHLQNMKREFVCFLSTPAAIRLDVIS